MRRIYINLLIAFMLPAALLSAGLMELPQRMNGRIVAMGGRAAGQSAFFKFQVDRWAGKDELRRLDSIFLHDGEEALLAAVANTDPAGWFSVSNGLRYYLRVITKSPTADGGWLIRALTDRPIQFGEIAWGTRSRNYGFGMVEVRLDKNGKGSGSLIPAARVNFKDGDFEVENFLLQSHKLIKIKVEKPKKK